jgi:hypothetical protein
VVDFSGKVVAEIRKGRVADGGTAESDGSGDAISRVFGLNDVRWRINYVDADAIEAAVGCRIPSLPRLEFELERGVD